MGLITSFFGFIFSWYGSLLIGILSALYAWRIWHNGIFKRRGIPHKELSIWFGHVNDLMLRKVTFFETFKRTYWEMPDESVSGFMQVVTPMLIVRDVELIKEITVKRFDCFMNHVLSDTPDVDKLFSKSLFSMVDQKWRVTRNMISPAFTGSKMRTMFKLMDECAIRTVQSLEEQAKDTKEVTIEVKDLFNRYCNDTIATTIFGLEVNSIKEKDNQFFLMGKRLTTFDGVTSMKFFLIFIIPRIFKLFKISLLDDKASDYFINLVKDTIQYRIDNNITRPDMINMYIESLKEDKNPSNTVIDNEYVVKGDDSEEVISRKWDLDEFVVQCVVFFFAGFETAASWFMFMAYELAINPEVQEKLLAEIDDAKQNHGDKPVTYEYLQSMKYFDHVVQETLRMWPVNIANDRKCTKDCTLTDSKGKAHHFKEGDFVSLPVIGLQRDNRYFEDGETFMPERWENKEAINPYTFLTFGIGPRMCIGNRYVMMEGKCIMYDLLSKFRIERSDKTQVPVQFKKNTFAMLPEKGMWLKFVLRN